VAFLLIGLRLIPELLGFLNPMPFEAATRNEIILAEDLRALFMHSFTGAGRHSSRFPGMKCHVPIFGYSRKQLEHFEKSMRGVQNSG
jgi:hypothetical protein